MRRNNPDKMHGSCVSLALYARGGMENPAAAAFALRDEDDGATSRKSAHKKSIAV